METDTKMEKVAFSLSASSYDGETTHLYVTFGDLRAAKIGKKWENHDVHNCGRDLYEESAEVVYKTDRGAAVLFRVKGTTDDPNPEAWESDPQLVWFEFAKGAGE